MEEGLREGPENPTSRYLHMYLTLVLISTVQLPHQYQYPEIRLPKWMRFPALKLPVAVH